MPTNYEQAFAGHPEAYDAWVRLGTAVKARMDPRRYELATLAAARARRSSYCCLAHGQVLAERFGLPIARLTADPRSAGLDDTDVAVMDFAAKVATDPATVDEADHERLHALGLDDDAIMDVALTAGARCFFSSVLDAMRVRPDAHYRDLPDDVRAALEVGRPIADPT